MVVCSCTIAGYFNSETIMALSDGNSTTLFHSKNKEQMKPKHIYFAAGRKNDIRNTTITCLEAGRKPSRSSDLTYTSDLLDL